MDNRERVLQKVNNSKGFSKVLSGVENGKNLQKKLSETKIAQTEEEMKHPTSFVSPFAGNTTSQYKRQKGHKNNKNNITLMEATTQNGKQELKLDLDSKKTSFTATAKRNIDDKGLREDMKAISPNTAKEQRKTDDYKLLLANGKKDAAATMELPKQRNWTDNIVAKLGGDNRSDMMSHLASYADTGKEKKELKLARQELAFIRKAIMKEQSNNDHGTDIDALRLQESEVQKKIDKLVNVESKKNMQKTILTQKLKYSTNPTLNSNFHSQFKESNPFKVVNKQEENEETNIDETNNDQNDSFESGHEIEGDNEE